jgi:hypothetical protein
MPTVYRKPAPMPESLVCHFETLSCDHAIRI